MKSPHVSVVIPTYNRAGLVARAIRSALAQTFEDFEVVVVDDGSIDDTERVVEGFGDSRLRYIRRPENGGEAAARNTGVETARGTYIAFLDADDEWLPEKLHTQISAFPAGSGEIRATCTGYYLHHLENETEEAVIPYKPHSWTHHLLSVAWNLGMGTTMLVERQVFDEIGPFDLDLARFTDRDWLIRYTARYDIGLVTAPLARVYHDPHHVSVAPLRKSIAHFLVKNKEHLDRLPALARRKSASHMWLDMCDAHGRNGESLRAFGWLVRALVTYPFHRPGIYLLFLDRMLGTSAVKYAIRFKKRLGTLRLDAW